jgi:hypothetical protein
LWRQRRSSLFCLEFFLGVQRVWRHSTPSLVVHATDTRWRGAHRNSSPDGEGWLQFGGSTPLTVSHYSNFWRLKIGFSWLVQLHQPFPSIHPYRRLGNLNPKGERSALIAKESLVCLHSSDRYRLSACRRCKVVHGYSESYRASVCGLTPVVRET